MFRIVAEQNDIRGKIGAINAREERLTHDENEFKRELQEASILVGINALHYKNFWPKNESGEPLTARILQKKIDKIRKIKKVLEKIKIRLEDPACLVVMRQ
jgi:hypothetical protein